jgi:plasmid maintenance system antidote protein VapI
METSWSDRIKQLEALGWSLTAIGEVIGLSPQSVSDIKGGRTKAPAGMAAVRLHELHGVGKAPSDAKSAAA